MFFKAFHIFLTIAILAIIAVGLVSMPGEVSIKWFGWRIDTSVPILVFILFLFVYGITKIVKTITGVRSMFRTTFGLRGDKVNKKGFEVLADSVVALEKGDKKKAKKLSAKAENLLLNSPASLIIAAQVAEMEGNNAEAHRKFEALSKNPKTEMIGMRGLIKQELAKGHDKKAMELITQHTEGETYT